MGKNKYYNEKEPIPFILLFAEKPKTTFFLDYDKTHVYFEPEYHGIAHVERSSLPCQCVCVDPDTESDKGV